MSASEPPRAAPTPTGPSPTASGPLEGPGGEDDCAAFNTAMVHLYRGEMHRMTVWRSRLDTTSHWAILLTTGMTTFALGASQVPHFILLLALALNTMFMLLEARRYQHLHHSEWRLRLLEAGYFSGQVEATGRDEAWRETLAADLRRPCATIGLFAAAQARLRRNYLMLFYFTTAVWLTKLFIHPTSVRDVAELYARLPVAELLPAWFVALSACLFVAALTGVALVRPRRQPPEWCLERRGSQR
jgi:uncharacterized membrane protein